jgi:hypothetical protein
MCALALALAAAAEQTASAWCSVKFSAGVNFEACGGGNSLCWGLYKSSPAPIPGGYGYPCPANGYAPPAPPAPCGYPYLATGPTEGNAWAGFGLAQGLGQPDYQTVGYHGDSGYWYGN